MRSPLSALAPSLLAAALLSNVVLAGCYSERLPPPTYRFSCGSNSDCDSGRGESCIDNLCQISCTLATFSDDCPDGNYTTYFNRVYANLCNADDPVYPGVQSYLTFEGINLPGEGHRFGHVGQLLGDLHGPELLALLHQRGILAHVAGGPQHGVDQRRDARASFGNWRSNSVL